MGDENRSQKKRKFPWETSYSNMTVKQAQMRIGMNLRDLASKVIPVEEMLEKAGYSSESGDPNAILSTKEEVHKQIIRYLRTEGYLTESSPEFKEANIYDLVLLIIIPILDDFICRTGRHTVQLTREKQIVSADNQTGSFEEFIVEDIISATEEKYILVIEAKRSSLGEAMKQCLLALKDMRDSNGRGVVYGLVTTGESWRMLSYDGISFQVTEKMDVVFETMYRNKERWMKYNSVLVDCINAALSSEGNMTEEAVVKESSGSS